MSATEHTPLPWDVVEATENHGPYIVTAFGTTVCDLYAMTDPNSAWGIVNGETKARPINHTDAVLNAPLIVHAVNCHDDLLAALQAFEYAENYNADEADHYAEALSNANILMHKALAKATAALLTPCQQQAGE